MPSKVCRLCGKEKDIDDFHKGNSSYGRSNRCKLCDGPYNRERRTPEITRIGNLRRMFTIEQADYTWLLGYQHGVCALCFKEPEAGKYLDIDHAHTHSHVRKSQIGCKECIRGLLCNVCNCALALLERCPQLQNDLARHYLARRPFMEK